MAQKCAIGLITAVAASVSLSQSKVASADGPFTFPAANPQQQAASSPPSTAGEESSAPPRARNDNPRTSSGGFDPEALERGAKALKEINNSSYAKNVYIFFFCFLKQLNYYYQIRSLCRISAQLLLLLCVFFIYFRFLKVLSSKKRQSKLSLQPRRKSIKLCKPKLKLLDLLTLMIIIPRFNMYLMGMS